MRTFSRSDLRRFAEKSKNVGLSLSRGSTILSKIHLSVGIESSLARLLTRGFAGAVTRVESDSRDEIKAVKDSPVDKRGFCNKGFDIKVNNTISIVWIVSDFRFLQ